MADYVFTRYLTKIYPNTLVSDVKVYVINEQLNQCYLTNVTHSGNTMILHGGAVQFSISSAERHTYDVYSGDQKFGIYAVSQEEGINIMNNERLFHIDGIPELAMFIRAIPAYNIQVGEYFIENINHVYKFWYVVDKKPHATHYRSSKIETFSEYDYRRSREKWILFDIQILAIKICKLGG